MKKLKTLTVQLFIALLLFPLLIWFAIYQPILFLGKHTINPPNVDPTVLHSHVKMLSETLPPRIGFEDALKPTVEWIENQLGQYGKTRRQSYLAGGETFHNIIIDFGAKTEERIVVGAHYDTDGELPGADDNASGMAGLIQLARLLSENPPTSHIELVAYTLEEMPHFSTESMGSYIHAKNLKESGKKVKLMISLEMIGYFSNKPNSQDFPIPLLDKIYPNEGNFIAVIGNLGNMLTVRSVKKHFLQSIKLPTYSFNAPSIIPGISFSDHKNYWMMGYPAVMITDTAFNRNKAYHSAEDTADRLDYDKMAEVVQAVYQTIINY